MKRWVLLFKNNYITTQFSHLDDFFGLVGNWNENRSMQTCCWIFMKNSFYCVESLEARAGLVDVEFARRPSNQFELC